MIVLWLGRRLYKLGEWISWRGALICARRRRLWKCRHSGLCDGGTSICDPPVGS